MENHGGPDQAVYLYSREDYGWWEAELGAVARARHFRREPDASRASVSTPRAGDRLRVGGALLELTSPRIPCAVFADRIGEPDWVKRFAAAERPGAYARVLEEGTVAPGDAVELLPADSGRPDARRAACGCSTTKEPAASELRRALAAPVAVRLRVRLERQLASMAA